VYASDGRGGHASDTFAVYANAHPVVSGIIPDPLILQADLDSYEVWLDTLFTDPEGLTLSYATSTENGIFDVMIIDDTILQISNLGNGGKDVVTLSATDPADLKTTIQINLIVNRDPVINIGALQDTVFNEGFGSVTIDLTDAFTDPDGDELNYIVNSNDESIVTVEVSGSSMVVTEHNGGQVDILVSATDGSGGFAGTSFVFKVNRPPVANKGTYDVKLLQFHDPVLVDLDAFFTDADMDDLIYEATADDQGLLRAEVDGGVLKLYYEDGSGLSNLRIIGSDGYAQDTTYLNVQVVITGLEDDLNIRHKVYPNPVISVVNIQSSRFNKQEVLLEILDRNGRCLRSKRIFNSGDVISMDLSDMAAGVYILRIFTDHISETEKILIE
jgi:hypothetical protein